MKMKRWFTLAAVALAAMLGGCQTAHPFATPQESWKTHIGQLKYSDTKRTLIGDVVVQQRGAQDFQLDFQKAGGFPLLALREDATAARAEGIFAHGAWQGPAGKAPKHLRNWVALREAFLHPAQGDSWKGESQMVDGILTSLFLTFPRDDQRFVFQFSR
jgi:hypothetical protein